MTDQNMIPADKVRELAEKYDNAPGNPDRLLVNAIADLRALLPAPPQPTTGLLGRWAKHPEHGDVVCVWNRTDGTGHVFVRRVDEKEAMATDDAYVPLSELTFPEQATRPEDVPVGEAWLVDVEHSEESHKSIVALKYTWDDWRTSDGVTNCSFWEDTEVTLIAPLTPERPGKDDLQAWYDALKVKYDALETKYGEAQERIKALEKASAPLTVTTEHDYANLPVRSVVTEPRGETWEKAGVGLWSAPTQRREATSADLAGTTRTVLRSGWGDEQPAWRIEHDWRNLKAGEYAIGEGGGEGSLKRKSDNGSCWLTNGWWGIFPDHGPWIVFTNKDAATPEAIEEAKKARDKETEK